MMKMIIICTGLALMACVLWSRAAREREPGSTIVEMGNEHEREIDRMVFESLAPLIKDHPIPFRVHLSQEQWPLCDALTVELHATRGAGPDEAQYNWQVISSDGTRVACPSFDDVYYRYEAPGCYNIRVVMRDAMHGGIVSADRHVCLE